VICGLDHVVVLVSDIEAGARACEILLGRSPSWRSAGDGSNAVVFTLDNMSLELMAPAGDSPTADHIREVLAHNPARVSPTFVSASTISRRCTAGWIGSR
jgi:hypothetical protein